MDQQVADVLAWLAPRAMLLAVVLPPLIRLVGHAIPEELFMITIGVLAAQSDSPQEAVALVCLVLASHFVTDQLVFIAGRWLRPRLRSFPRVAARLELVTSRLDESPAALLGLIPARVLPLGRAAWLAGCGVVGVPWTRFALVDLSALLLHVATWSGLGWWLAGDLGLLSQSAVVSRSLAVWVAVAAVFAICAVLLWRRRPDWQPATGRVIRRAGRSIRQWSRFGIE